MSCPVFGPMVAIDPSHAGGCRRGIAELLDTSQVSLLRDHEEYRCLHGFVEGHSGEILESH